MGRFLVAGRVWVRRVKSVVEGSLPGKRTSRLVLVCVLSWETDTNDIGASSWMTCSELSRGCVRRCVGTLLARRYVSFSISGCSAVRKARQVSTNITRGRDPGNKS